MAISGAPKGEVVDIAVRVTPRAGRSGIAGRRDDVWLVRLAAAPVEGAANAELIAVLADALDVPKRQITIISGDRSRQKRVRIAGLSVPDVDARLTTATRT